MIAFHPQARPRLVRGVSFHSFFLLLFLLVVGTGQAQRLASPNGTFRLDFSLGADGAPVYHLFYKGKEIIRPSRLGIELKNDLPLTGGFVIADSARRSF